MGSQLTNATSAAGEDEVLDGLRRGLGRDGIPIPAYQTLGVEVREATAGAAVVRVPRSPLLAASDGGLLPGAFAVLADACCGCAIAAALPAGGAALTAQLRVEFIRPLPAGHAWIEGRAEATRDGSVLGLAERLTSSIQTCWPFIIALTLRRTRRRHLAWLYPAATTQVVLAPASHFLLAAAAVDSSGTQKIMSREVHEDVSLSRPEPRRKRASRGLILSPGWTGGGSRRRTRRSLATPRCWRSSAGTRISPGGSGPRVAMCWPRSPRCRTAASRGGTRRC